MTKNNKRVVVALAQIPPPVTGLSAVSGRMIDILAQEGLLLRAYNVGPSARFRALKFPIRLVRTFIAVGALIWLRLQGASKIYLPTDSQKGLALNALIAIAANLLGYRAFLHHHNFSYIDKHSRLMDLVIKFSPRGTVHISLCASMADGLQLKYLPSWVKNEGQRFILSNGIFAESTSEVKKSGRLIIGHLSNLSIEKGALRFISLFRNLIDSGVNVEARMAGPSTDPVVTEAIRLASIDFPDEFAWVGPVYGAEKTNFYNELDIFVFPSSYENEAQPLVLLEALAHGAAILATDIGCIACDHGDTAGAVFNQKEFDTRGLEWIQAFAVDTSRRSSMPHTARTYFSSEKAKSQIQLDALIDCLRR